MILALLMGIVPQSEPVVDHVAEIELNFGLTRGDGRPSIKQWIFWDYCWFGFPVVVDWRNFDPKRHRLRRWGEGCELRFWDGNCYRVVRAEAFRFTVTEGDPEMEARRELPKKARRLLSKPFQ